MTTSEDLRAVGDRIEGLLDDLQRGGDPRARAQAEELLRLVTQLYGAGLARLVDLAREACPELLDRFVDDDLVASLLVVHDLHPDGLAARVERALESVRPILGAHEGDVELLAVDPAAGVVRLRLLGSCDGCPSSSVTLRLAVEQAIAEAAPEIVRIDVDEPTPAPSPAPPAGHPAPAGAAAGRSVPVELVTKPAAYDRCPTEVLT